MGKGKEAAMFYMWFIWQFMQEFTVGVIMDTHNVCANSKELSKPCHDHMCGVQLMRGGVDGGNLKDFATASSSSTQTCRTGSTNIKMCTFWIQSMMDVKGSTTSGNPIHDS